MSRQNVLRFALSIDIPVNVTDPASVQRASLLTQRLLVLAHSIGNASVIRSHYATVRGPTAAVSEVESNVESQNPQGRQDAAQPDDEPRVEQGYYVRGAAA